MSQSPQEIADILFALLPIVVVIGTVLAVVKGVMGSYDLSPSYQTSIVDDEEDDDPVWWDEISCVYCKTSFRKLDRIQCPICSAPIRKMIA